MFWLKNFFLTVLFFIFFLGIAFFFENQNSLNFQFTFPAIKETRYEAEIKFLEKYSLYMSAKRYDLAEKIMLEGISKYPGFSPFYYNLFILSERKNDFENAKKYLQKFIELEPKSKKSKHIKESAEKYNLI